MQPPQQQYPTPQTDRPFRRTQSNHLPPSPQSERPFRVVHSQTVFQTPSAGTPHTSPAPASGRLPGHTPQSDRPFRVTHSARAQQHTGVPAAGLGAGTVQASAAHLVSDAPFTFMDPHPAEQQQYVQQGFLANGSPGTVPYQPAANGVPLLYSSPSYQHQPTPPPLHQQHEDLWQQQVNDPYDSRGQYMFPSQQQQQQQQQRRPTPTPQRQRARRGYGLNDADTDSDGGDGGNAAMQHDWNESLLRSSAANAAFISSMEGLATSPEYRQFITEARRRQLTLEQKEKHKLNVYKALRQVDPQAFRQLFTRQDVLEYDELPLSKPLAVLDCLLSALLSFTLLGLPLWLPAWRPLQQPLAVLWLVLQLAAVCGYGCSSLFARALSIYASEGPFGMSPSWLRLLTTVLVDTALVVLLPGVGLLAVLCCRLMTEQGQSCGERLLRLQPVVEVVRPMHFSRYAPGRADGDGSSLASDDE